MWWRTSTYFGSYRLSTFRIFSIFAAPSSVRYALFAFSSTLKSASFFNWWMSLFSL